MKQTKSIIQNLILMLGTCVVAFFAVAKNEPMAINMIYFITIYIFLSFIGEYWKVQDSKDSMEKLLDTYREGQHLPQWVDLNIYWFLILLFAIYGWLWTAFAWVAVSSLDMMYRKKSESETTK